MEAGPLTILLNVFLFSLLGFLHGMAKAMRDTIDHHWGRSVFNEVKKEWLYKWLQSDWTERPKTGWRAKMPPLWDGWHFGDFLTALLPIAAAFYGLSAGLDAGLIVFYVFFTIISFNFFYKRWFLVD